MAEPSFKDTLDFNNVDRGFIETIHPCIIKSKDGRTVWNTENFEFLKGSRPETVNAKLWRQSQLCLKHGLFKVTDGIYQVRGFDLSNITFIEGSTGVLVMDPLVSSECAEAALRLYWNHRGDRPVKAIIYTHSHIDHFGGALGVLPESSREGAQIPIIAPDGFLEEALGENVFAGPSMRARAAYMYGTSLQPDPKGLVGCALGLTTSRGTTSLCPPTDLIKSTGEERAIDGVRIVFQMVPDSEAPSEFNLFFPDKRALCIAECATHCLHNIITLRGALVRDAKRWSKYLDETIVLYGQGSDVLLSGHHWPTWGQDKLVQLIAEQRDLYAYLHDQTLKLMNQGLTGIEIAEQFQLPLALQQKWHTQGFYGSISHNVKGIYQRYMTWFDGNPANLWKHTPTEEGKRYVECMGGSDGVVAKAKEFVAKNDLRFAATLLDHAVAAEPHNQVARSSLADVYEKLGFGAENATWRNFYLTGAQVMKRPAVKSNRPSEKSLASINPQGSIADWFDSLAVQLDGLEAGNRSLAHCIDIHVSTEEACYSLLLSNGALTHRRRPLNTEASSNSNLSVSLTKEQIYLLLAKGNMADAEKTAAGDINSLRSILELCGIQDSRAQSRL